VPTWGELLSRLKERQQAGDPAPFDTVRREALSDLATYTGRNVILYAAAHHQKPFLPPFSFVINNDDIEGFMEVFYGLTGEALDLILHSPGGRAEATEAIVNYMRSKFRNVRVLVPHEAMSAATMLACAADRIVMGRQSYMGPIDPQFQLSTALGLQSVPAQAILDQFERAKKECTDDRDKLPVWIPTLQQYGPALLEQCTNALSLSRELVSNWLARWMFKGNPNRLQRARDIAAALADHNSLLTHGRPLTRDWLRQRGMKIEYLERDQRLQDKVLTVYHAAMHTFSGTSAVKLIENHMGRALIRQVQTQVVPLAPGPAPTPAPPAPARPPSTPTP